MGFVESFKQNFIEQDRWHYLVNGLGTTLMITFFAVLIGMVLGFLPVVGITLPLFSSGGTSALSTLISLGLVQSVRYHNTDDMNKAFVRRGSSNRIRM